MSDAPAPPEDVPIEITGLKHGTTRVSHSLHVTGGVRAGFHSRGHWTWFPTLAGSKPVPLRQLPIQTIDQLARDLGAVMFGGDESSQLETALISRTWRPLDGPNNGELQPADLWAAIGGNAERRGDEAYGRIARNIAFSLHSAGIRLRDASDGYKDQLLAAIDRGDASGHRFSNGPMRDIQLAFHSVLSELASARDYLAAALGSQLGAPAKTDAMNRLAEWLGADSRKELRLKPIVSDMLVAYDRASADPWLFELTEYRNLFLHRNPLGASGYTRWLRYDIRQHKGIDFPFIEMPLSEADPWAPGRDALLRFLDLYRKMTALLTAAIPHAAYPATLPSFVAR